MHRSKQRGEIYLNSTENMLMLQVWSTLTREWLCTLLAAIFNEIQTTVFPTISIWVSFDPH